MEASEQGGEERRILSNAWLVVGIAVAALLVIAWIAWVIYVAADKGGREALGVLIAWPAIVVALAIVATPFVWAFRRLRGRSEDNPSAPDEPEAEATTTG